MCQRVRGMQGASSARRHKADLAPTSYARGTGSVTTEPNRVFLTAEAFEKISFWLLAPVSYRVAPLGLQCSVVCVFVQLLKGSALQLSRGALLLRGNNLFSR